MRCGSASAGVIGVGSSVVCAGGRAVLQPRTGGCALFRCGAGPRRGATAGALVHLARTELGEVVLSGAGAAHEGRTEDEGRAGAYGGAVVVADAAGLTDAVVSVSAPARWYYRGTAPMRRLHWVVTRPLGRAVGRHVLGTRIQRAQWDPVPLSPVASVPLIAPTPLLIVHGDLDPYFPLDHPRMLASAADGSAELWLESGMGHAEHAADDALLARIGGWATAQD
ncbi:alpha/beta hydrolase [Streptomyces sp. E11-3]|uniref:alpha/beta hydrolase n=1 Tax=Streptomyces sp. E11-3 TaxID=3110112 RepID=UPI00397EB439